MTTHRSLPLLQCLFFLPPEKWPLLPSFNSPLMLDPAVWFGIRALWLNSFLSLGHRAQGNPTQSRGRYNQGRWGPGDNRFSGNQQRRQWSYNEGDNYTRRNNFYGNQQKRQWNNYESEDDRVMKLQASEMMTSKEKEWLVKIHLMTLLSDDPQNTDYYYVVSWIGFVIGSLWVINCWPFFSQ